VAFLIAILTLALIGLVVLVVGAPLRRARRLADAGAAATDGRDVSDGAASAASVAAHERRHDELEAAREAKYREIRDAELDFRTGKLSREDYQAIDADLRAEAIEILDQIEPSASEDGPEGRSDLLEQQERVEEEQHRKEDGPAV
jgi:hypothetical protein